MNFVKKNIGNLEMKNKDGLYCCGKKLEAEEGVNGSFYFECKKCKKGFNVLISEVEE